MSSSEAAAAPANVRRAEEGDIPAILALLLTSFRQFDLFAFLYAPLYGAKDNARDTVWFWGRRLLVDLLDPSTTILVAETSTLLPDQKPTSEESMDDEERESWAMLEWVTQSAKLSQASPVTAGNTVVGFAIWNEKPGWGPDGEEGLPPRRASWTQKLRTDIVNLETYLWKTLYQRRDQDPMRFSAYLKAEEDLQQRFYQNACYYLDNLCVDFRCQRMGVGKVLLQWGLDRARDLKLPASTEAGSKGEGLYQKMDFVKIGTWSVSIDGAEAGRFDLPVMRWTPPGTSLTC